MAEAAEMGGMAAMGNKVARATMEQLQRDGPTVAYVLPFADTEFTCGPF
jgi:hypothetical protein